VTIIVAIVVIVPMAATPWASRLNAEAQPCRLRAEG
jgi:hypothetical protein